MRMLAPNNDADKIGILGGLVLLAMLVLLLGFAATGCEVTHRHEHQHHYDALPTLTKKGPDGKPLPVRIVIQRNPRRSVDVR